MRSHAARWARLSGLPSGPSKKPQNRLGGVLSALIVWRVSGTFEPYARKKATDHVRLRGYLNLVWKAAKL